MKYRIVWLKLMENTCDRYGNWVRGKYKVQYWEILWPEKGHWNCGRKQINGSERRDKEIRQGGHDGRETGLNKESKSEGRKRNEGKVKGKKTNVKLEGSWIHIIVLRNEGIIVFPRILSSWRNRWPSVLPQEVLPLMVDSVGAWSFVPQISFNWPHKEKQRAGDATFTQVVMVRYARREVTLPCSSWCRRYLHLYQQLAFVRVWRSS